MPATVTASYVLHRHPATACPALLGVTVEVGLADGGALRLRYTLRGQLQRLRLPPAAAAPQARDGLWRHTCFEAFVGAAGAEAYREFNFSPSGDWAGYAFAAERQRDAAREPLPAPRIEVRRADDTLTLLACLPAAALPGAATAPPLFAAGARWALGLSAVIEQSDGALSYWALAHPRPQPDFHHRGGWAARLSSAR